VIGWAEDEYVLPPREKPCEFQFPEDIVVPSLPGPEAGNQGVRTPSQASPGDFERGRKWSSRQYWQGPRRNLRARILWGLSVREEKSKDSRSGGAQVSAPRQETSQEGGLGVDHRVQELGEAALYQLPAIPQTFHSVPISQIRPTIGFMVEVEVQGVTVEAVVDTGAEV
jgi:hypothetical protein